MPRRTGKSQEIVHLPPEHPNQDQLRSDLTPPPYSPEQRATLQTWAQYAQETQMDRASYDNAVDAARFARDRAYEAARQQHTAAVEEADRQFDAASTAAWKTFYSNSDSARSDRDARLDAIRHDITKQELEHAMHSAARERIAGDDGGYEVFGDQLHYNDEGFHTHPDATDGRYCPRCATTNDADQWEDNVCPNCGQYVAPLEVVHPPCPYCGGDQHVGAHGRQFEDGPIVCQPDPETPAAPTTGQGTSEADEQSVESAAE